NSKKEAKDAFMAHYDSPKFYGGMDVLPMDDFKKKVLGTATEGPHKIEAWGEPQVYDGGYQHIADTQIMYNPPSLKGKVKRIPTDDPREDDDSLLDVTKRKSAATKAFRDRLTKQHTDANWRSLNRTLVSGFPAVTIGGFG